MAVIVGIDLGGTKLRLVCGQHRSVSATGSTYSASDLEQAIRTFIAGLPMRPRGIGIAIPGLVDEGGCVVVCDVLPRIVGWCAREALVDLGCGVAALNDVKAALIEEMRCMPSGSTAGIVMAGTGVGAAFLTEGRQLLGASGWAGELGYIPIAQGDVVRRLDELAGGRSMAAKLNINGEALFDLAHRGDEGALNVVREGGHALGLGLATVVNLLNPAFLAVGGGALALPGYWEAAQQAVDQFSIPVLRSDCRLYRVDDKPYLVALGAAHYLQSELSRDRQSR